MIPFVEILILFLAGLLGGFFAGLLGIGGGAIYVIIFSEYFERSGIKFQSSDLFVKMVIANALFSIMFAGISGTIKQIRIKNFYPKEILLTAIPASFSALFFTYLLSITDWYSKEKFSIFFVLILFPLVFKTAFSKEQTKEENKEIKNPWWIGISGLVSGFITSLTGLGGGFWVVGFLSSMLKFPIKKSISISLGAMSIVAFVLSIFYFVHYRNFEIGLPFTFGAISLYLTLPVIAGVLIFAPIGVSTAHKLSPKILRICLFVFFILIVGRMVWKMI